MMMLVYVAVGGAIGSVARYLLSGWLTRMFGSGFPYGIFTVNVLGAFLMGVLLGVIALLLPRFTKELHALLAVGLLGGFTTFSAFTVDTWLLYERNGILAASGYAMASVVCSLLGLLAGMWLLRTVAS